MLVWYAQSLSRKLNAKYSNISREIPTLNLILLLIVTADTLAVNGLQVWDVADASGLRSIGKINLFREK